jgi:hypothetical protein
VKEQNIFLKSTEETSKTAKEILRTAPGDENLRRLDDLSHKSWPNF